MMYIILVKNNTGIFIHINLIEMNYLKFIIVIQNQSTYFIRSKSTNKIE